MAITLQESLRALFYAPFYVALARDAYAAEGVDVRFVSAARPGDAARNVMDGAVDVCWGGPMRVMQAYQQTPECDLVSFAEVVTRDPFMLVGRAPRPNFSLRDLVGLRIATVSEVPTPWMCLQEDLRRAGIDPSALTRVADAGMADNVAALRRGDVDVVQVFEPFAAMLLADDVGHLWYAQASRGPTSYTTFYARRRAAGSATRRAASHGTGDLSDAEVARCRRRRGDSGGDCRLLRRCASRDARRCLQALQVAGHLGPRSSSAARRLRTAACQSCIRRLCLVRCVV